MRNQMVRIASIQKVEKCIYHEIEIKVLELYFRIVILSFLQFIVGAEHNFYFSKMIDLKEIIRSISFRLNSKQNLILTNV